MYSYAYGINHKNPPQRHHRIPALSQRQLFHEWPAPLFIHINPTLHIHIIDIHYSFVVHITGSLFTRFSLFVWDFRIQDNVSVNRVSHPFAFKYIIRVFNYSLKHTDEPSVHTEHKVGFQTPVWVTEAQNRVKRRTCQVQRRTWLFWRCRGAELGYRGARLCTEVPRLLMRRTALGGEGRGAILCGAQAHACLYRRTPLWPRTSSQT